MIMIRISSISQSSTLTLSSRALAWPNKMSVLEKPCFAQAT